MNADDLAFMRRITYLKKVGFPELSVGQIEGYLPDHHVVHRAVLAQDITAVHEALAEDVLSEDFKGALDSAVLAGYTDIIRVLLSEKPDVVYEHDPSTPLHYAVVKGNAEICQLLIENPDFQVMINQPDDADGNTPLGHATGNEEIVELLLAAGSQVDPVNSHHDTPLCIACSCGDQAAVSILIAHGADVNHQNTHGNTALMLAANGPFHYRPYIRQREDNNIPFSEDGYLEVTRLLLQAGASVNIRHPTSGKTVLQYAAERCDGGRLFALLTEESCDLNVHDDPNQPLLINAIQTKNVEVVRQLIQANCQVEFHKNFGDFTCTPFELAFRMCEALAMCNGLGSRFFMQSSERDWKYMAHLLQIMQMLVRAGAKVSSSLTDLCGGLEEISKCADVLEYGGYGPEPRNILRMLSEASTGPRPLMLSLRDKIRMWFPDDLESKLKAAGLPESLRDFVIFSEEL